MTTVAERLIKQNEGFRSKPYNCTEGKLTIAWGRNLDENGVSEDEANYMLRNDMDLITKALRRHDLIGQFGVAREAVLYDMAYQMGVNGLLGFKNMLRAMRDKDFSQAAHDMLDSRYAVQTPNRAERNARIMRTNIMQSFEG